MGWTPRQTANNEDGLAVFDSYAGPGSLGPYTGTATWAMGSVPPVVVGAAILSFPAPGPPVLVQSNSSATALIGGGFTTYAVDLPSGTTPGNFVIVDIAWTSGSVSGARLTDDSGLNFYWPSCQRATGSGDFLCCYVGFQQTPANIFTISQGPGGVDGPPAPFEAISVCVGEYSGVTAGQPGAIALAGSTNGSDRVMTAVGSDIFPSWLDACYCNIHGLGTLEVSYIDSTHLLISGSGAIPLNLSRTLAPVWPPDYLFGDGDFPPFDFTFADSVTTVTTSLATTSGMMLHFLAATYPYYPEPLEATGGGYVSCIEAWLSILEPGTASPFVPPAWVDQSARLHLAESVTFSWIVKHRGTAKIPLIIDGDDSYEPTIGSQVCLWDMTDDANYEVFSGTIDDWEIKWLGQNGDRTIELTCVSFESIFDEIRVPSMLFIDQTAGYIFTALFALAAGSPVSLGAVGAGETIANFLISDYPTISDVYDKLATLSEYVWGVDPGTATAYFTLPDVTPSPFTLDSEDVLWEQFTLKEERHDYRNRQIIKVNSNAAVQSSEYFVGVGQLSFTLLRPVDQITYAWITQNIQNSATGTFTGQPSPGDTISFDYSNDGWVPLGIYTLGQAIIDSNGYRQVVTSVTGTGQVNSVEPTWIEVYAQTTSDGVPGSGNAVIWTNRGPAGFGNPSVPTYTFVTSLTTGSGASAANAQFGYVLIGSTLAITIQNLVDAINGLAAGAGTEFSLATWENPMVNADEPPGSSTFVVRDKAAGAGFITALSWTGAAFSFNATQTFGGRTSGGTSSVTVGVLGQSIGGGSTNGVLAYTPGSDAISLSSPLNSGSNLQVQYLASDAGYITVEDTGAVLERAAIEQSTGKYQQSSSDDNALTLPDGLQLAQQQLAAYGVIPSTFEFTTFLPGLYVGQVLAISMTEPGGPGGMAALVNGNWFIREINAELIPIYDGDDQHNTAFLPGAGHYRYTIQCIDVAQVSDWLDFWEGLSGGGGGSAAGAIFPGGGGLGQAGSGNAGFSGAITVVAGTPLAVTHALNTEAVMAVAYDSSGNQMLFSALAITDANTVTVTFGIAFTGTIVVMGVA